jgi:hypothetical protein
MMKKKRLVDRIPSRGVGALLLALLVILTSFAARSPFWLDGGGFPTPTSTPIPTETPTETPTAIPLEALFPTETPTFVFPAPADDASRQGAGLEAQVEAAQPPSSPNLLLLAVPFLLAAIVLGVIVLNWIRRSQV